MQNRVCKGRWRHFKGYDVRVLGVAKHTEDPALELVIYTHDDTLWARPLKMFLEDVEVGGKKVPRFEYVGE